jgi:hypothetical protein
MRKKTIYAVAFDDRGAFKFGFCLGVAITLSYYAGKRAGRREEHIKIRHIPYHRFAESVLGKRVVE